MVEIYTRIDWVNKKDGQTTPLGATNLNKMDAAISEMDKRIVELDAVKADKFTVNTMLADCEYDEETGIVKLTRKNGEQIIFDLNIEKIPVAFALSESGVLTMTTEDGTEWTADIGAMIPVLTFNNSDTVNVIVTGSGKNKTYSFEVKDGSITEDKLRPNYLAEIKVESGKAATSATNAATSERNAAESAKTAQECKEQAGKTVEKLVPAWARQESKPEYTAVEVGADPAGAADNVMTTVRNNYATKSLTGVETDMYGGTNISYEWYDVDGGYSGAMGVESLNKALAEATRKIAETIAAVHGLVPARRRFTIGNATAADSVLITDNGIITLRVYKISNDQLMAVNQHVYVSDTYGDNSTLVSKLAANTGALSNTYGTIAVSTADKAVKVTSVKGYRIEITVMDCI